MTMLPDNNNEQDGTKPEENDTEEDVELTDDDFDSLDDEDASKKFRTLDAQRHRYKNRMEEEKKLREELEAKLKEAEAKKPATKEERKTKSEEIDELRGELRTIKLSQKFPDLDADDMKRAFTLAEAEGKTPEEVVGSSFFQAYLKDKEEAGTADDATPKPSNRTGNPEQDFTQVVKNPALIKGLSSEQFEKFKKWKEEKGIV